jgi:hypothetical protein
LEESAKQETTVKASGKHNLLAARFHTLLATSFYAGFSLGLFFHPED